MKTSTIVWVVIILLILIGGGWYWYANSGSAAPVTSTENTNGQLTGTVTAGNNTVTVLYGPNGFSPSPVTINRGDTVTFVNNGGSDMWVTGNNYDNTTMTQHCAAGYTGVKPFDQCATGTSYSFMFNNAGTWTYHNQNNSAMTGTVIVQ